MKHLELAQQQAAAQAKRQNQDTSEVLGSIFADYDTLKEQFEERLFNTVQNSISLAKRNPTALVRALQVVELEERADVRRMAAKSKLMAEHTTETADKANEIAVKGYFMTALDKLKESIEECFKGTFWGINLGEDLARTKQLLNSRVDDLTDVLDVVAPCFPPHYDIFNVFVKAYNGQFYALLARLDAQATPNSVTLALMFWARTDYTQQLARLGAVNVKPSLLDALLPLITQYKERVKSKLYEWFDTILRRDVEKVAETIQLIDGQLLTTAPVDVFDCVQQQVTVAEDTAYPPLQLEVAHAIVGALLYFKDQAVALLSQWKTLELEYLIALVNNTDKCCELTEGLADRLSAKLPPELRDNLDMQPAIQGFTQGVNACLTALVKVILYDVNSTMYELFEADWLRGQVTEPVLACAEAYLEDDYRPYLLEPFVNRISLDCLGVLVYRYSEEMFGAKHQHRFSPDVIAKVRSDVEAIHAVFGKFSIKSQVEKKLLLLSALSDLIGSPATQQSFCEKFHALLVVTPDAGVPVAEFVLARRPDVDKAQVKELAAACRDVWAAHQAKLPEHVDPSVFSDLKLT
eukprot:TRINITY_DN5948_c0_g1_i3.p1 TRINITY_DN5948_c0_g1~~TRINITY_DN5948_c0_g1_i3.p1  ORF type:complete len:578 (+),score=191.71 TRINITY_DN5948_c0_g1_i3:659-2392(+)